MVQSEMHSTTRLSRTDRKTHTHTQTHTKQFRFIILRGPRKRSEQKEPHSAPARKELITGEVNVNKDCRTRKKRS